MSRVREKRINKLKRTHLWPTITFLVLTIIFTSILCMLTVGIVLSYFATDRLQSSYLDTKKMGEMYSESMENGTEESILRYFERSKYSDAVFIIDDNGEVLAGYGEATFDSKRIHYFDVFSNDSILLYFDKDIIEGIIDDQGDIDSQKLFTGVVASFIKERNESGFKYVSLMRDSIIENKTIFEENYWLGMPVSDDEILVAKQTLYFYSKDLGLVLLIGVTIFFIIVIPLVFLFINVLLGIANQKRMTKLLHTDPITYGDNWMCFENNAERILTGKRYADNLYAIVDIAIMKYRNFCTFHGIDAGEDLLEKIDKYLKSHIDTKSELSAHNGRASFALLLKCNSMGDTVKRVDDMVKDMEVSLESEGHAYHAGIYFIHPMRSEDGERIIRRKTVDVDELYNYASSARTVIGEDEPSKVSVFDQKLMDEKLWEHRVEEKMQAALDNEEFVIYIQPKYNPATEELAGAEALVRWINDEDGFVPPGRFIPIFENNGFITKLDDYMISHIAKLQTDWIKEGKQVVPVSVNVSRAHFADENLAEHICELVDKYGCPHEYLEIELTESAFFDDKAALIRTVKKLQDKGFEISMDDFGAGYSSLNSLKDLPLDVLKLDAEFFRGEDGRERGEIVVSQAIALAKKLNMKIVAEGIEKKEQVDFLAEQECDMIQGYYFAKPMPEDEYAQRMKQK